MKILLTIVALLAGLALKVQAEDTRRIALDGTGGAAAPAEEVGKDGIARIKKIDQAVLEIFPTTQKPAHGTLMICPGGGYAGLAVTHEGRDVAKMLNAAGWDAAVLLYHISAGAKTRELALADAKDALALLQKRGAEFGLASGRLGVMGFSAGGHLAARLAHETAAGAPPGFLVLMYPAYLEKDGKCLEEVAPAKAPAFLYVAADDKFAPSSVAYADACREHQVRCDFHQAEQGGHGFGLKKELPVGVRDWPDKLRAFLAAP
ncbi:MAG: hypothetical protein QOE70_4998 [Chthoniobacter sp.]|jgi:acetyl esterase/lipase|nr:hypothetical protein [Chthoniobacter sp.]